VAEDNMPEIPTLEAKEIQTLTPVVSNEKIVAVEYKCKQPLVLVMSLMSGEIYEIEADEVKNLEPYQLPLKKRPKSNCRTCYGRGWIGKNISVGIYQWCPHCFRKCIDYSKINTTEELKLN